MWFKNLVAFQLEETPHWDDSQLQQQLEQQIFKPCGPQQLESFGWTSPMGELSDQLFHRGNGVWLLTAKREERILPASVIREAVGQKVQQIEKKEERKIGRKQKMELRDQLTFEMMPRAFTRSNRVQGMLLEKEKLLVVDSASRKRAEDWLSLLRASLGTLSAKPLYFNIPPPSQFTRWLKNTSNLPKQIELGDECVLQSPDTGGVIRCKKQDLEGKEILTHLDAGKLVTQLAVDWNQSLSFVVNQDGDVKRLRFSDTLVEQAESDGLNDPGAEFDARFTLLGLELSRFLPALWQVMGGLEQD